MFELAFDTQGYLTPYHQIEADLEVIEKYFIFNEHREILYQNYLLYLADFQNEISTNFVQWINGSFISLKDKPNDIDFITFMDYEEYQLKEKKIAKFKGLDVFKRLNIDAYFALVYPENHSNRILYELDKKEWLFDFSQTNAKKTGKIFSKGFLELKFE